MNQTVKKIRNINLYSLGAFESWLSDMAQTGLHLIKINYTTCSFLKSEPANMEYRLEISSGPLSEEQKELYLQFHWEYVCSYREVHIFRASAAEDLIEIHTDAKEQSYSLTKVAHKLTLCNVIMLSCIVLILLNVLFLLHIGNTPYINFYENGATSCISAFSVILLSFISIKQSADAISIKKGWQKATQSTITRIGRK